MEKRINVIVLSFLSLLLGWSAEPSVSPADVSPGDVIDQGNWQKAEGLLPEPVLDWIRKGDILRVGALEYDPGQYLPEACQESLQLNAGLYDVDEEGILVDAKTRKLPGFVTGLPFPQIDLQDPKAGWKVMYNKFYYTYTVGNLVVPFEATYINRKMGIAERTVELQYLTYVMDGHPQAKGLSNPDGIELYSIIRVLSPFDVAGTNVLTWRYRDGRADSTFCYVPAIRRVRRMSPANRSDAFLGSDFTVDDAWGYSGKVSSSTWRVLRKEEQLSPFFDPAPQKLDRNERGEYVTGRAVKEIVWGCQVQGYPGSPWFPTNLIWVKRPTYVLEVKALDPYYNYGTQYLWIDAEFFQPTFKVIHDRAGAYWKVEWQPQAGFESTDGKVRLMGLGCGVAVDDRTDHATVLIFTDPRNQARFFSVQDRNDYSLGGFQKLCK